MTNEFNLPDLGEGIVEAELVDWLVAPGDVVEQGQSVAEVMTDKATLQVPSPFTGTVTELRVEPGDDVKVGEVLLCYDSSDEADAPRGHEERSQQPTGGNGRNQRVGELATQSPSTLAARAAPSVRRMARQMGIDLAQIPGSGPGGRILIEDLASLAQSSDTLQPKSSGGLHSRRHEDGFQAGTRVKLRGVRRRSAELMIQSKHTIPHCSYVDECDVSQLVQIRASLKERAAKANVKLTYLPFFVKAVVTALREVPIVNSSLSKETGEIVLHDKYHIGIATETPRGLLVPMLRNADELEFLEVARQIERLTTAARDGKIRREELRGGTFTITSIGNIGGLISTPIINYPQAAILGIGKIVKRPVYDDAGNIHPADMVYLSLSFDHRLIDGASAATFTNAVISRLMNPAELLLARIA